MATGVADMIGIGILFAAIRQHVLAANDARRHPSMRLTNARVQR
jgi:hypothetical protein